MKITTVDEIPTRIRRSKYDDDIDDIFKQLEMGKKLRLNAVEPGFLARLRVRRKADGVDARIKRIDEEVYVELKEKPVAKRPKTLVG